MRHAMGEERLGCSDEETGCSCLAKALSGQSMSVWLLKYLLELSDPQANQSPATLTPFTVSLHLVTLSIPDPLQSPFPIPL